ncbi:hypothetical protein MWU75_12955 [Ornithinimicrobium sp. F0845]|uniref:hypothetical protein n=1 Tax=Ornithinimicrobium sp. F0845 TaxID=2926412 RepID=UPI001FF4E3BA|nr:hypothetical protein [Ornithinimicrobium sp. F0845]MCK0113052.1 hypothetical protein [Ornithinimicrobium sp. F0845]
MSDQLDNSAEPEQWAPVDLLERADQLSPQMSLDPGAVLAAGRQKVRRRRALAGGVGALALAGAVGLGGVLDPFTTDAPMVPAAVDWAQGLSVEVLDNQPHPSEVGRTHWQGELRSGEGDARPDLVVTKDGVQLDPIQAEDGPGDVLVYRSGTLVVAVWASPAGSTGERPLWNPGSEWGQGGDFMVDGARLWYASTEFVESADPGLQELYWFSEDAGHAASGAPVESTVLTAGDTRAVVMIDEARGVWGTSARATTIDGNVHIGDLVSGAGTTGWLSGPVVPPPNGGPAPEPADVVPTTIAVLPPGATLTPSDSATTEVVQGRIGSHTVVLASDPTLTGSVPQIEYAVGDQTYNLQSFMESGARTLEVGDVSVQLSGTPDGLQLFVAPGRSTVLPNDALEEGGAVLTAVAGGRLLVVPGWEPADLDDVQVQVTGDPDGWVSPEGAYAGQLFDGTPFVALALDEGVLAEGETVQAVGVAGGDTVAPHDLEEGVHLSALTP